MKVRVKSVQPIITSWNACREWTDNVNEGLKASCVPSSQQSAYRLSSQEDSALPQRTMPSPSFSVNLFSYL